MFGTISRGLYFMLIILSALVTGCHLNKGNTAADSSIQVSVLMCSKSEYDCVLKSSANGNLEEVLGDLQKKGDRLLGVFAFDIATRGFVEDRRRVRVLEESNRVGQRTVGTRVEVDVTNNVICVNLEMSVLSAPDGDCGNQDNNVQMSAETSLAQGKRIIGNSSPNFLGSNLVFVVIDWYNRSK